MGSQVGYGPRPRAALGVQVTQQEVMSDIRTDGALNWCEQCAQPRIYKKLDVVEATIEIEDYIFELENYIFEIEKGDYL